MKLRIERERLLEALTTVLRANARSAGTSAAANGVRLKTRGDRAQLFATGTDLQIEDRFPIDAGEDGTVVLPARLTHEIVRSLSPEAAVDVIVSGVDAEIVSGKSHFTLRITSADDFPEPPEVPSASASFETAALAVALRQVLPAAADAAQPVLSGVLFSAREEGLRLVATDSYRLAIRDLPGATVLSAGEEVILPATALGEVARLLGTAELATLRLGETQAVFDIGSVRLSTRLVSGSFPDYARLLPGTLPNRLVIEKEELLGALGRTRVMCEAPGEPLALEVSATRMQLRTTTNSRGSAGEELVASYAGEPMTVGIRPDFLRTAAEAIEGDTVIIALGSTSLSALLVEPPSEEACQPIQRTLVMPTRLA